MIPIWVFALFIVLFVAILIWERVDYKNLEQEYEAIAFFLDLYIGKYGPEIALEKSNEVIKENDIK